MADDKDKAQPQSTAPADRPAAAPAAAPRNMEALSDLVGAANALQQVQAAAAIEATRLPDKRLDDAGPNGGASGYTLKIVGDKTIKVDANGNEIKD